MPIVKWLLIGLGSVSVGLGVIGIFLPLLPTTPFLLLAAACYIRSSDKFYRWLITNRWFGRYIRNYREKKGVPVTTKVVAISLLWITIGYSAVFAIDNWAIRILLGIIAIGVTIHLLVLKTLKRPDKRSKGHLRGTKPFRSTS
ncbi:MAG: YbaN family protein [Fidelibacterota bacterium]|nr:MAG: YbaN family protein [Candidatus Neomarinimicrobiota bacterium]